MENGTQLGQQNDSSRIDYRFPIMKNLRFYFLMLRGGTLLFIKDLLQKDDLRFFLSFQDAEWGGVPMIRSDSFLFGPE